ncbi:hypothetical protein [Wolbachia endosymbiont (group A) of Sphaerophoria taeniata]|uniref:hypothetical protein n=1 Tax=Wolbachia endosymbiont (group A) of Sphaerophoria taeniata TaxID=2954057 RepID=UPI002227876B|nr:hypothetical protein [Wolbachia endosymbiont (group A) of Sphaerophoria taeniata]
MSNYSVKESESNFGVTSRMSGTNRRIINDIEVKIKPKSFEGNKEKNASVDYVHKILDKLVKDLNDTFVLNLDNILTKTFVDYTERIHTNSQDYKFLKENFDNLNEEVEKLKTGTTGGDNIDEWEAPTHFDIL